VEQSFLFKPETTWWQEPGCILPTISFEVQYAKLYTTALPHLNNSQEEYPGGLHVSSVSAAVSLS